MLFYKNTFQLKILLHSYKDFFTDDGVTPLKKGYQLLKMCDANVKGQGNLEEHISLKINFLYINNSIIKYLNKQQQKKLLLPYWTNYQFPGLNNFCPNKKLKFSIKVNIILV